MDISEFATQEKAESGVWFQAEVCGQKMPMELLIYGDDSDVIQNHRKEKLRALKKATKKNNGDIADEQLDEILDNTDDVIKCIGGVRALDENGKPTSDKIELFGKTIENDEESYRFLIDKVRDLKNFILAKSKERANFLEGKKKN